MNEEKYKKLKASAQRYTAYKERSPKQVKDKLSEWGAPMSFIERILEELKADKFIDEYRFARAFCHDKFLINRWGRKRIRLELAKYGLSESAVQEGLSNISDEEYRSSIHDLATAKWARVTDTDVFRKKNKVARYLAQKGFESDLIWEMLSSFDQ